MREALLSKNKLVVDRVMPGCAISGAVGAMYYRPASKRRSADLMRIAHRLHAAPEPGRRPRLLAGDGRRTLWADCVLHD